MKKPLYITAIIITNLIWVAKYVYTTVTLEDEKMALHIRCAFLEDYKRAFMNHIPKCDTMHKNCVRMDDTEKVLPNISK